MKNRITLYDTRDNTIIGPIDQFELAWVPATGQKITLSEGPYMFGYDFRVHHVEHKLHFGEDEVFQQVDIYLTPDRQLAQAFNTHSAHP